MIVSAVAVTTVHEQVHQRTSRQQQEGEIAGNMCRVLLEQEIRGDSGDDEERHAVARSPEPGTIAGGLCVC